MKIIRKDKMDEISFVAKYKDWIVVKKKSIDEETKNEEIIATLSSISDTTTKKAFDFSGINKTAIESYVSEITKGKRKGFGTLAEIFSQLKQNEVKERLVGACGEEKFLPIAEAYFLKSILSSLGYFTSINSEILRKIYPELKIPKPRGRMKK